MFDHKFEAGEDVVAPGTRMGDYHFEAREVFANLSDFVQSVRMDVYRQVEMLRQFVNLIHFRRSITRIIHNVPDQFADPDDFTGFGQRFYLPARFFGIFAVDVQAGQIFRKTFCQFHCFPVQFGNLFECRGGERTHN